MMCLALFSSVRADEEEYHVFTDVQGRTFKGKLMEYDAASAEVVLTRSDGKTGGIPLTKFSDADRTYIREWGAEHRFQNELEVAPSLKVTRLSSEESGISDPAKKVFDVFYQIRFINRSDGPIGPLAFEYCIFYNQGERDDRTIHFEEGSCYGKGIVDGLDPLSEQVSNSKPVRLYTDGGKVGLFGTDVTSLGNIRGIWLRLKTTLPSGREIEREYRTSDDEFWDWAPYTFGAGLNEGEKKQTYYFIK
jgi:hypothetical protein